MSFDFDGALRRRKPDKRLSPLRTRPAGQLTPWTAVAGGPVSLVLDANVYIYRAAGRLPVPLREMIDQALLFHCSVTLAELATGVANADPSQPGWLALRAHYTELIGNIPANRILVPDEQVWADAGVIAGMLARTQGFQPHQRKECLNDALILLTAAKVGLPVLTADRDHYDLIQQLAPEGQFVFFEV